MRTLIVIVALATAACGSKDSDKASGGGSSSSAAVPERPAVITKEMSDTFDAFVGAFEKLVDDIAAAKGDCKAAVASIERDAKDVEKMSDRATVFLEGMKTAKGDKSASDWFEATFIARMKAATGKLGTAGEACGTDQAFRDAMNNAMSKFPMMKKKS